MCIRDSSEALAFYTERREYQTAQQAIGYKELADYFEGNCTLEEGLENLKKRTRNYAKRQLTWFRDVYKRQAMDYYNEMIADKLEAGLDEEEVIAQFGPVEEIADKLIAESEGCLLYTSAFTWGSPRALCRWRWNFW